MLLTVRHLGIQCGYNPNRSTQTKKFKKHRQKFCSTFGLNCRKSNYFKIVDHMEGLFRQQWGPMSSRWVPLSTWIDRQFKCVGKFCSNLDPSFGTFWFEQFWLSRQNFVQSKSGNGVAYCSNCGWNIKVMKQFGLYKASVVSIGIFLSNFVHFCTVEYISFGSF